MPGVSRLGDVCTGHGCFPSRPSTGASPNVFVNGIPVHRQGDSWAPHCCVTCHGSALKADLIEQILELMKQQCFDYIVIEASGICEPEPPLHPVVRYLPS